MEFFRVGQSELFEIMNSINLIRMKFGLTDMWVIAPVLFFAQKSIEVVNDIYKLDCAVHVGEAVLVKFQKNGFEYLITGELAEINIRYLTTVTIRILSARKIVDMRKYMRFDTNLKTVFLKNNTLLAEGIVKNISAGGAMAVSNTEFELNDVIDLHIIFRSKAAVNASAKIVRKVCDRQNEFVYGFEFDGISEDDRRLINYEAVKYGKGYRKLPGKVKKRPNEQKACNDKKIAIFSSNMDEVHEMSEMLVKIGAENFNIFHSFKFYLDFFVEEKPGLVVIDTKDISEEIIRTVSDINSINGEIINLNVIIILPEKFMYKKQEIMSFLPESDILFKPLIYNEFEQEIVKYL